MSESLINYPAMLQKALLSLVRDVLVDASDVGLPGEHHLYISFDTNHEGVSMPSKLRTRYEEEMTIVLQNQFWDLETNDEAFSVTLRFDGDPTRLTIPYDSIRSFVDPTASFGLKFETASSPQEFELDSERADELVADGEPSAGAQILSFDRSRTRP